MDFIGFLARGNTSSNSFKLFQLFSFLAKFLDCRKFFPRTTVRLTSFTTRS
jgi:hypothetical protein